MLVCVFMYECLRVCGHVCVPQSVYCHEYSIRMPELNNVLMYRRIFPVVGIF